MSNDPKMPAQETIWRFEDEQALATLTPEQLAVARRRHEVSTQALAAYDAKNQKDTQAAFNKRVNSASDYELNHYKLYGSWPEKK